MRQFLTLIIIPSIFFISCSTKENGEGTGLNYDSSKIAILSYDRFFPNIFDTRQYRPSTINQQELKRIDSIMLICVTEYNNSLESGQEDFKIKLGTRTKIQIVVAVNQTGQKEVWINCFCHEIGNWNRHIKEVDDGGPCYFNFKINLTTDKYFDLSVNGFA